MENVTLETATFAQLQAEMGRRIENLKAGLPEGVLNLPSKIRNQIPAYQDLGELLSAEAAFRMLEVLRRGRLADWERNGA